MEAYASCQTQTQKVLLLQRGKGTLTMPKWPRQLCNLHGERWDVRWITWDAPFVYRRKKNLIFDLDLQRGEEIILIDKNLEHTNRVLYNFPSSPLADLFMKNVPFTPVQSLTIRQVSSQNASPLWCWQPPSGMGSHNSTAGIWGTSVPDPCVNFQSSQGRVSILGMPMVSIWVTSGISHQRGPFFAKSFPAPLCGLLCGGTQRSTKTEVTGERVAVGAEIIKTSAGLAKADSTLVSAWCESWIPMRS